MEGDYEEMEYFFRKESTHQSQFFNTYGYHAFFKMRPPFGQIGYSVAICRYGATEIDPIFIPSLRWGTLISTALEDDRLARIYYQELQQQFKQSNVYREAVSVYNIF